MSAATCEQPLVVSKNVATTPCANPGEGVAPKTDEKPKKRQFPAYYEHARKTYWSPNARGGWIEINETALRRLIRAEGYSAKKDQTFLSPLEEKLVEIQTKQDIAYAGALAGHGIGVVEEYGNRVLVTSAPKLIEPCKAAYPVLSAFLRNLLGGPECDQERHLFGWLKIALESLHSGKHRPGQALAIAGPRQSGKSLLQNLVTVMLGGRAAKPYRYMSGATDFNGELFGAEHLMIEDDIGSTDFRARRNFGNRIKDFTVNETQSCHPKNRQAISLRPFWRLTISLNEEPENLQILPPLDESLQDKLILLKAQHRQMPMPTTTQDERARFCGALMEQLPGFLWFLRQWEIPPELRSERFGITHYHHPELLSQLDALAPENKLLEIIDIHFEPGSHEPPQWQGTAAMLESALMGSATVGSEARRLLNWTNAAGTYLGRLAKKHPDRIKPMRSADKREWQIKLRVAP